MDIDQPTGRRAIRYLKRGVFPPDSIEHFTAGRERETRHITDALAEVQQGASRHCFVEANYGFGKSHMLKVAESVALQRGFAVSWVTINGAEHAFNHPTRYLHSLLENLRVPDVDARGLVELCSHWLANSERENLLNWTDRHAPWEFRWPIDRLKKLGREDDNSTSDWVFSVLEGRDLQHKNGCNYFPNFYQRLETTVALCRAVGRAGVLFLFDEVECIATHLNNVRSRMLSYQVLNTLVDGRRFPHAMFLFATTEDLGARIASDVFGTQEYETSYAEGYRFAKKWHAQELKILPVKNVSKSDNKKLFCRIREVHAAAYGWDAKARISDGLVGKIVENSAKLTLSQREITRSFVNILEICQQHPDCDPGHELFGIQQRALLSIQRQQSEQAIEGRCAQTNHPSCEHPKPSAVTSVEPQTSTRLPIQKPWADVVAELQEFAFYDDVRLTLPAFLKARSLNLEDIYREQEPSGWTKLKGDAFSSGESQPEQQHFNRYFVSFLKIVDSHNLELLAVAIRSDCVFDKLSENDRSELQTLFSQIQLEYGPELPAKEFLEMLKANAHAVTELRELL